jgi:hypothetical protein
LLHYRNSARHERIVLRTPWSHRRNSANAALRRAHKSLMPGHRKPGMELA